jgi:hypothetical protein
MSLPSQHAGSDGPLPASASVKPHPEDSAAAQPKRSVGATVRIAEHAQLMEALLVLVGGQ